MRFQDLRKMANDMDINTYKMKKVDIIHAIQTAENNIDCYGTERVDSCQEQACLWKNDCLSLNNGGKRSIENTTDAR